RREGVRDGGQVGGEMVEPVGRRLGPVALAVTTQIRGDQTPARDQGGHERGPPVRVPPVAVHEQRRRIAVASPDQAAQPTRSCPHRNRRGLRKGHVHSSRNRSSARGTTDSYPSASIAEPRSSMSHHPSYPASTSARQM